MLGRLIEMSKADVLVWIGGLLLWIGGMVFFGFGALLARREGAS
jgi:hypothetical protein